MTVLGGWQVEVLQENPIEMDVKEMVVFISNTTVTGQVAVPEVVEVAIVPPAGGGYDRVEVLPFSAKGPLVPTPADTSSEFPIMGGNFLLESFAARVVVAPVGAPIVLDILKNNVSIFTNPADRPSIAAGSKNAVTTIPASTMFADGDYIEVIIVSVGSTTPGETLTAAVRLTRIG